VRDFTKQEERLLIRYNAHSSNGTSTAQQEQTMSSSAGDNRTKYGSIEDAENAALDRPFDAADAYYLKDGEGGGGSGRRRAWKERVKKCSLACVPLLAAVLIVGLAVFFLLRDFNHLYPGGGRGGGEESRARNRNPNKDYEISNEDLEPPAPHSSSSSSSSANTKSSSSGGSSSCASHSKCAEAGLLGDCCPTTSGVVLECC